eukprot:TRINITY_DN1055_c0_g1_i2.p1 TRINITY_DN1055_c0_g1~~TRINITY_DN1055_c0_g1_i2.p1  ORF type:complete len:139 (+),score=37.08 TRINITY_DN1055_c0_g1_i2:81-497(+)
MCIRDRYQRRVRENDCSGMGCGASTAPREEPPAPPAAIPLAVVAATAVISPEDHQDEEEHAEEPPPEEVDLFAAVVAGRLHEVHSVCSTLPERVHQRDYVLPSASEGAEHVSVQSFSIAPGGTLRRPGDRGAAAGLGG